MSSERNGAAIPARKRIAIVGSGIAGLSALYSLQNSDHEVHLFEKDDRLGGHTNTRPWKARDPAGNIEVDTGFIVINTATYPNLLTFLEDLKIEPVPTEMTFAVSRDQGEFEWCGNNPFCQTSNLYSPSHWRMLFDFVRFNMCATDILREPGCDSNQITIGEYLDLHDYSKTFRDDYLLPMTACVWSTGPEKCALDFPAVTLIRFMMNHRLLNTISKRPQWKTIYGGSKQYITKLIDRCQNDRIHIRLSTPIESITPRKEAESKVIVQTAQGPEHFDAVILACHGDQAYKLLSSKTHEEESILSSFETTASTAYLHSDRRLLPKLESAWSAWNYISSSSPTSSAHPFSQTVSLTYNMNILQHISASKSGNVLVTLNPPSELIPSDVQEKIEYRHPLYTNAAVRAQRRLPEIQGIRGVYYAGAWTGYGFHEDGCTSGLLAAAAVGGKVPFEILDLRVSKKMAPLTMGEVLGRWILDLVWLVLVRFGLISLQKRTVSTAPRLVEKSRNAEKH